MKPHFYPARPVNGGRLEYASEKLGNWVYEPKINEERVLVHTPTGEMYARDLRPFSKTRLFTQVIEKLKKSWLNTNPDFEWLDCGAFGFRHNIGRGSLVVFDIPMAIGHHAIRQQKIHDRIIAKGIGEAYAFEQFNPPENKILSFSYTYSDKDNDPFMRPRAAWLRLQEANKSLGVELFEGLVAKRADSKYPIQNTNPKAEFGGWMKHRFTN